MFKGGKTNKKRNTKTNKKKTSKKKANNNKKLKEKETRKRTYSKKQYNSGDGMLTTVWGPSLWHTLHTMSFNYPVSPTKEEKKQYRDFILSLQHVLPCKYCRMNLKSNFKSLPLTMEKMKSRDTFSRYIYDLHELINKMLKKQSNLSYCDVRNRYEHFRARCTTEAPDVWKLKNIKKHLKKGIGKTKKNSKEKGCTEPLYSGEKSKCIIKIVPQRTGGDSFQMDNKCVKQRVDEE